MDMLQAYRVFLRVADAGSFSRVAEDTGLQQSQVSRLVAATEARLGVQLFRRTTRAVTITEDGQQLRERLAPILEALEHCEDEIRARRREPSGLIRVAAPSSFGRQVLAPLVQQFLRQHPKVRVELLMSNAVVDLAADGVDIALRIGRLPVNDYPTRRIGVVHQVLVASAEYLAAHGAPQAPAQLAQRNCLCFASGGQAPAWTFHHGEDSVTVAVQGDLVANDADVLLQHCLGGAGIAMLPLWLAQPHLREGRLQRVLPDWEGPALALSVITTRRDFRPQRIAMFLALLETGLAPRLAP